MGAIAIPFVRTLPATGPAATSGVMSGGGGQNFAVTDTSVLPYSSRKNVFAYADYDVSDQVTVYAQGMFGWQTLRQFGRVGDFLAAPPQQITIYRENAFLPDSVADLMDAAGASSFTMTRAGTRQDWGWGSFANINDTTSATVGFKSTLATGGFLDGWSVDGYFQYGKNKLDAVQEGGIRLDRMYLATDAVVDSSGSIRCNITVISGAMPDCVPLNVFGRGNADAAALDWIKGFDPGVEVTVNPFLGFGADGLPVYGDPYTYVGDEDKHRLLTLKQKVFEVTASGKVLDG